VSGREKAKPSWKRSMENSNVQVPSGTNSKVLLKPEYYPTCLSSLLDLLAFCPSSHRRVVVVVGCRVVLVVVPLLLASLVVSGRDLRSCCCSMMLASYGVVLLVVALVLVMPGGSFAQNIYVSEAMGVDQGNCTLQTAPCQTIAYAVSNFANSLGTTVNVMSGTYSMPGNIDITLVHPSLAINGMCSALVVALIALDCCC
jgi:hypothetical protein